ncbi:hypothetical protein F2Q68_00010162 [Brassica cretica]|uniref:Uncharacterized protein n=1 Tax=Brassica cretica TaxID=69181 RepID=A0A8S9KPA5_BRACR|nr:hypothetical protein F2Q68_00010162 [Brassica cretica]
MEGSSIDNLLVVSINGLKGVSINTPTRNPTVTLTSSKTLFSPSTDNLHSPEAGTASFVSGISPLGPVSTRHFVGHMKDVLYVALFTDNRQIVFASCDGTIKLWNTLGECKYTISNQGEGHKQWVSCVRFSPNTLVPTIVSASWDHTVKVLGIGGKDGAILLWDLAEGKKLYSLEAGSIIHSLFVDLKAEAEKSDSSAGTRNETKVIYCKWSADGDTLFSG